MAVSGRVLKFLLYCFGILLKKKYMLIEEDSFILVEERSYEVICIGQEIPGVVILFSLDTWWDSFGGKWTEWMVC